MFVCLAVHSFPECSEHTFSDRGTASGQRYSGSGLPGLCARVCPLSSPASLSQLSNEFSLLSGQTPKKLGVSLLIGSYTALWLAVLTQCKDSVPTEVGKPAPDTEKSPHYSFIERLMLNLRSSGCSVFRCWWAKDAICKRGSDYPVAMQRNVRTEILNFEQKKQKIFCYRFVPHYLWVFYGLLVAAVQMSHWSHKGRGKQGGEIIQVAVCVKYLKFRF